jgi:hypothetical protein
VDLSRLDCNVGGDDNVQPSGAGLVSEMALASLRGRNKIRRKLRSLMQRKDRSAAGGHLSVRDRRWQGGIRSH